MGKSLEKVLNHEKQVNWKPKMEGLAAVDPSAHLLVMFAYLLCVASFGKYDLLGLVPLLLLPAYIFYKLEMPTGLILEKLLWIEPFIVFVALMNPIFDHQSVVFMGMTFSAGWITFLGLIFKSLLTLTVALQYGLFLGIDGLSAGLLRLKVPDIFVSVIGLLFRYLTVLMEETLTLFRAYRLRAPMHKGVHFTQWGSFAGQLILRSYDRALRIENAMKLRGSDHSVLENRCTFDRKTYIYLIGVCVYLGAVKWLFLIG